MKRVLVTGGSRGIGRAIVRRFVADGAHVLFCFSHDVHGAETLMEEAPELQSMQVDLRDESAPERLVARMRERFGGIDVLVNSAGVYPHAPLMETTPAVLGDVIAVNLTAPFALMRAAAAAMPAGEAAVVNITSINAFAPDAGLAAYDASKAALAQLTRTAALELGAAGIRVNAVAPGLVDDPGLEAAAPERRAAFLSHAPLGRLVAAEDVAEAVHFLASPRAAAITGHTLVVDAGVTLAGYTAG